MINKQSVRVIAGFLLIALVIVGCEMKEKADQSPVLAKWDGGQITENDLEQKLKTIPSFYRPQGGFTTEQKKQFLEQYAVEEMFYDEAKAQGVDTLASIKDEYLQAAEGVVLDVYRQDMIDNKVKLSDKDLKEFYEEKKDKYFSISPQANILYIQTEKLETAQKARQALDQGKEFSEIVEKYATDDFVKRRKGKINNVHPGNRIPGVGSFPEVNEMIFSAQLDQINGPMEKGGKFHIFRVMEKNERKYKPYPEVKKQVENFAKNEKRQQIEEDLVDKLFEKYNVTVDTTLLEGVDMAKADTLESYGAQLLISSSNPEIEYTLKDLAEDIKSLSGRARQRYTNLRGKKMFVNRKALDLVMFEDALEKGYEDNPKIQNKLHRARMVPILREYYKRFVVDSVKISDEEIENLYEEIKEKEYSVRPMAKIRQFVCPDKETAEYLLHRAKKATSENELAELVQEYCTKTDRDGVVSPIYEEGTIPGHGRDSIFNAQIFKTEEGEFSEIFQDKEGNYMFLKVIDHTPKSYTPLEDVQDMVREKIDKKKQKQRFEELKEQIREKYNLQLMADKLDKKHPVDTLFSKADKAVADQKFHRALNYYDQIIKYYSDGKNDYRARFMKGFIYAENLNRPKKAVRLFNEVLEYPEYPDVPKEDCALHESARYMIDEIEGKSNLLEKIEKMPADSMQEEEEATQQ